MDCQHCSYFASSAESRTSWPAFQAIQLLAQALHHPYLAIGNLQHADMLCPCAYRNKSEQGMPLVRRRMLLGPEVGLLMNLKNSRS